MTKSGLRAFGFCPAGSTLEVDYRVARGACSSSVCHVMRYSVLVLSPVLEKRPVSTPLFKSRLAVAVEMD